MTKIVNEKYAKLDLILKQKSKITSLLIGLPSN